MKMIEEVEKLISSPTSRIGLDHFVSEQIRKFLITTSPENFPANDPNIQADNFRERLQKYEELTKNLQEIVILLARWGDSEHLLLLEKIIKRLTEGVIKEISGTTIWLNLNWYPLQILMYSSGIAALVARKYDVLKIIFTTQAKNRLGEVQPLVVLAGSNLSQLNNQFKLIPGFGEKHVPRSEYLFTFLRDTLENLLFLGETYEELFDYFEVYSALVYSDAANSGWGPIGRFGWKYHHGYGDNPLSYIIARAKQASENWPPIQAGLFQGSYDRFLEVSGSLQQQLNRTGW